MTARAKHVLVVEDEQHLAVGIKYNLEAEGYRVTSVSDGKSALAVLGDPNQGVDLVILDLMLPEMSGYKVCQSLRDAGNDIPVMILSARTLSEDRTRGFEVGADQYLTKPFDLDELLSRVRTLLALYDRRAYGRIARAQNGSVYRFGDTSINFGTHEVSVRGQAVSLTQLELKLLQYFVQNPGRVISRDELLEQVWELPASITTRAVDQFIRRLRKLFEPNPSEPIFFLTLRDAGYRFVADAKPETRS